MNTKLEELKDVSRRYMAATGKSLKLVGEIAELELADKYNLILVETNNHPGYDAVNSEGKRFQIKAAVIQSNRANTHFTRIKLDAESDVLICAVYDKNYNLVSVYLASKKMLKNIERIKKYGSLRWPIAEKYCRLIYGKKYKSQKNPSNGTIREEVVNKPIHIKGLSREKAITALLTYTSDINVDEVLWNNGFEGTRKNIAKHIFSCRLRMK